MLVYESLLDNDEALRLIKSDYFKSNFELLETKLIVIPPILFYSKLYGGDIRYYHGGGAISVPEDRVDDLVFGITFQNVLSGYEHLKEDLEEFLSSTREYSYLIDTDVGDGNFKYPFLDLLTEHVRRNLKMVEDAKVTSFKNLPKLPTFIYTNSMLVELLSEETVKPDIGCFFSRYMDMLFVRVFKVLNNEE